MRIPLIILSCLLVLAVVFNFFSARMEGATPLDKQRNRILQPIMGLNSIEKEIGPSESLSAHAIEVLGMTWYDVRELNLNGHKFSVYVAFWRPKTVNFFEVAQHVPDQCWVANGMLLVEKSKLGQTLNGAPLPGVNARKFGVSDTFLNTWFWHAVGEDFVDYSMYGSNRTSGFLVSNLPFFFKYKPQVLLRIDSTESWDQLTADPQCKEILSKLTREVLAQVGNHVYGSQK
jgi:hypothetical protein